MLGTLQTWLADQGFGQYPLPRTMPGPGRPDPWSLWLKAMTGIILTYIALVVIAIGVLGLIACYFVWIAIL